MRSPWLFVPPPLLFVGSFAAGIAIGRVVPASLHVAPWLGVPLVVIAAALALSSVALFVHRRTTLVPHSAGARTLVAQGPFRITRNPMYLGLAIAYVGAALIANAVWPLVMLALPLWVMSRRVIPHEEATLSRIFGESYRAYQQRVRRWL